MMVLERVTKLYGGQPGVRDVSFSVERGSRTVIVGPSGSGKTTLLRLIAGFEEPDSGALTLSHRSLCADGRSVPPHRRNIAYVAQEGALFPHMSVADNIGFAISKSEPSRKERIGELLDRVGLPPDMGARRPHELSGGQQQRVALARALAQKPDLMLLDEPFSALDTGLREAMRDMVGTVLSEAGITTVLVTHDQAEALAFADHLVVMRAGLVADAGPPQRLYAHPADVETARFLGEAIVVEGSIKSGIAETALGPVTVASGDMARATILIRPEQIVLSDSGSSGTVTSRSYRGAQWRLDIKPAADIAPIAVDVPASSDQQPGMLVHLQVKGTAHVFI